MESLKPQDIVIVLKLCVVAQPRPSIAALALDVGLSPSEVHAGIRRATASGLLVREFAARSQRRQQSVRSSTSSQLSKNRGQERPNATAISEFLTHGLKYVFPARRGELTRGIPTSYAAPPLDQFITRGKEPIPVWPYVDGRERGIEFEPLYPTVPFAAIHDPRLYELLAIADALREGRARERKLAEEQLRIRLRVHVA